MIKHSLAKISLASTLAIGLATPVWAQDSGSDNGSDIIVTARRTEEKLQDVPISITVLSQEAIAKRNIVSGSDLGTYVPSLVSNQQFGPEKASFAIRGFTQEGKTSPSVAVYFADVVAPRSFGGTTAGNGAGVGSFMDLQNVQVLKGPQGTLFGRNSTGGAILLVPTKPKDRLEGSVEATVGSYNLRRIQAVLNAPLGSSVRVRGAVDWNKRDGYLVNHSGVGPDRLANTNYVAARLSVVADLSPDVENYTIGSYSKSDTNGTTPTVFGCNSAPGQFGLVGLLQPFACAQANRAVTGNYGNWGVENPDPRPRELVEQWQVINTTTWKASDNLTIKNIVSYAEFKEFADFNLFGDNLVSSGQLLNFGTLGIGLTPAFASCNVFTQQPAPCSPLILPSTAGQVLPGITLHPGLSGYNSQQSTFTEELQFQGTAADGRLNWQAGAYVELSKPLGWNSGLTSIFLSCSNVYTYQCTNPLLIGSISSSNVKTWFNSKGLYGQATYKLTDQLSLTGGFRYTWDRMKDISQNVNAAVGAPGTATLTCQNIVKFNVGGVTGSPVVVTDLNSSTCANELHQDSSRPTWLIDLDYKPNADILIYANWRRGYRQGTINSNNLGLEIAKPEKVDTFEVGAKTSFHGAVPGYFNISAFYNNFTDQQLAINSVVAPAFQGKVPNAQPMMNISGNLKREFIDSSFITPFISGLQKAFKWTYKSPAAIVTTDYWLVEFEAKYCRVLETPPQVDGAGPIEDAIPFICESPDGTTPPLTITFQNRRATVS